MMDATATATLTLTPFVTPHLSIADREQIGRRCVDYYCRLGVISTRRGWTVRINSWAKDERGTPVHSMSRYHLKGNLVQHIHALLDCYQRDYVFSPDELAAIRAQAA